MGLDIVELVIEVEETFDVKISDSDAQKMRTVGDLIQFVLSRKDYGPPQFCLTSRTFYRLRRELLSALPLSRREIKPGSYVEALVPIARRRAVWKHLKKQGLDLPPTRFSPFVGIGTVFLVLVSTALLALWLQSWLAVGLAIPLLWLAFFLMSPLAIHVGAYQTIRSMVLHLTPSQELDRSGEPNGTLSKSEIADKVRLIVAGNLGVSLDQCRDEASFADDLGAD